MSLIRDAAAYNDAATLHMNYVPCFAARDLSHAAAAVVASATTYVCYSCLTRALHT